MGKTQTELSIEELEALLVEKRKAENEALKEEKKAYENKRNEVVKHLASTAKEICGIITAFNQESRNALEEQKALLDKYGKIRGNSKGGFAIEDSENKFKVVYQFKSISGYDERADKAEALLKEFLNDTIKKKDKNLHEIIMSLLERNSKGHLEYARVQSLYKFENDYDDVRWKEAIKLFKESFSVKGSKMQVYFYEKNEHGTFDPINLNFSSF